jgi:hypothetical protein
VHKQRYYFNKHCAQAFKDGKHAYTSLYESKASERTCQHSIFPLFECRVKKFKAHPSEIAFDAGSMNGFVKVLQGVSVNS